MGSQEIPGVTRKFGLGIQNEAGQRLIESSLVLLEEGVCYDSVFSWQSFVSLHPALFCTPRPNLPVTPVLS